MKQNTSKNNQIVKCFHCGNETIMERKGEYSWGSRDIEDSDFGFSYTYELFACPVCHKATLRQTYSDETMLTARANDIHTYDETTILYPPNSLNSHYIPVRIRDSYEKALKIKNYDKHAGLLMLRRTLEMILNDKGADKWGLQGKIEELTAKGILSDSLKDASFLTKKFGDSAAHDKDMEIEQEDVDSIAEFVEFILEYLYIIPAKLNTYQELLGKETD